LRHSYAAEIRPEVDNIVKLKKKKRERYEMHPSSHGNRRLRHDKMIVFVLPKKIIVEKLIACERLFKENQGKTGSVM
jgi:hypothetical protein